MVNLAMNGNQYRCKVTNTLGTATSTEATLTVNKIQLPTPTATIDYVNEKLTGLTAGAGYKIKVNDGDEQERTADEYRKISIEAGWFGKELSIKTKASDENHIDSEVQTIPIPARPNAPNGLQGKNETFAGENDGKITGTTAQMEYKLANGNGWTRCSDNSTSLAPGTYQVRKAATGSNFASTPVQIVIATGKAHTYTLNVTAPTFDAVEYGYTQPTAKPITIQNTGNTTSTITKVELNNTGSFEIAGSGNSVNPGSSITTYTIQPKEGLAVGTHRATITVTYTGSVTAAARVSFTVGKATQTPPVNPELDTKTHNSVTLKVISANSNAAVVEYSKDGGNSYQESNTFTGLNPSTTYNFVARYKETENYKASEKSAVTEITTDNAPASGGGSTSGGGGSSSGGSSNSGSTSGGGEGSSSVISDSPETKSNNDRQNMENTDLLPLKVDANGNATITKDIILKAIKKAKAEAKNGKETAAKIAIETGAAPKSIKISIKSDALKELVSSNIHRFVLDTDRLIDLGFNSETLKELKNKTKGDVIFSISKTKVTSSGAKKAIGKRPVYDISIAYSKNGQETKIENLNGKTVSIAIPYKVSKKERNSNLYAVYVDKQGKVEWLTKSSYDKDNKAVIFVSDHFSVYGVGYKKDIIKFKDITKHRAKEDILFVAGRGILSGIGKTTFSPDERLTRGMLVTALGRLAQVDAENYKGTNFKDVKENAYYTPYANWAVKEGIVSGKDTFSPNKKITKEQMAVIMKNYAEKLGYRLPKTFEEIKFSDNEKISTSAKDAVRQMQMAGILSGKKNNRFDPKGKVTRAETSTMLHRFMKIVINQ